MNFITGVIESFIFNLPEGVQIEGLRYLLGAGGIFLLTWVLLAGVLQSRRIRKPLPPALRNRQMLRFAIPRSLYSYLSLPTVSPNILWCNYGVSRCSKSTRM